MSGTAAAAGAGETRECQPGYQIGGGSERGWPLAGQPHELVWQRRLPQGPNRMP